MCRTRTPDSERIPCSRCKNVANPNDGWEHGWPLFGRLDVGIHSCAAHKLGDPTWTPHPAIRDYGAQRVIFEWGNGYEYDSRGRYRLCAECQADLLGVLGAFFGVGKPPVIGPRVKWGEDTEPETEPTSAAVVA
jgi:hypothetical protein